MRPEEPSRAGTPPVGDADIARLAGLSPPPLPRPLDPRADCGAGAMPRGVTVGTGGRVGPVAVVAAVRRRALSVDLVKSLGVMGPRADIAEELVPETRALRDPPDPRVVAADAWERLLAADAEESLAKSLCTSDVGVVDEGLAYPLPFVTGTPPMFGVVA
mmetsp:Transcript_25459/g.45185  ORF Transcript_25459/g.45185 Transcript_25459/m.45185 type:complete len:160 (-) Transcript_25459:1830-2309(-)